MTVASRRRLLRRLAGMAGLGVAVLGPGGAVRAIATPAVEATPVSVSIANHAYTPATSEVTAGETVTWTNDDDAAHDVTGPGGPPGFASERLDPGASYSFSFADPGTFTYVCVLHPEMGGTVVVAAAEPVPVSEAEASAPSVTIPVATMASTTTALSAAPSVAAPSNSSLALVVDPRLVAGALVAFALVVAALMVGSPRRVSERTDTG